MSALKKVAIHTDGGCHGNPGPGGWAAVLTHGPHRRELSGGSPATTNNRMELQAAIEGLRALKVPCQVDLYTDSQYLRHGISSWIARWKANGWRTSAKKPVKNAVLWRALDSEARRHVVRWHWVKGHSGHAGNERCDRLAQKAIARIQREHTPAQLRARLLEFRREASTPSEEASGPD